MTQTKLLIAALMVPALILVALVVAVAGVVHWLRTHDGRRGSQRASRPNR